MHYTHSARIIFFPHCICLLFTIIDEQLLNYDEPYENIHCNKYKKNLRERRSCS